MNNLSTPDKAALEVGRNHNHHLLQSESVNLLKILWKLSQYFVDSTIPCAVLQCYLWTVERNLDADLDFIEVEAHKEQQAEAKNKV